MRCHTLKAAGKRVPRCFFFRAGEGWRGDSKMFSGKRRDQPLKQWRDIATIVTSIIIVFFLISVCFWFFVPWNFFPFDRCEGQKQVQNEERKINSRKVCLSSGAFRNLETDEGTNMTRKLVSSSALRKFHWYCGLHTHPTLHHVTSGGLQKMKIK